MTANISSEVPRWMLENRLSRDRYLQEYGVATFNPESVQNKREEEPPKRKRKNVFNKRLSRSV